MKIVTDEIGHVEFDDVTGLREYMVINWSDVNIYTSIGEMYKKVVHFINWYNENKK